MASNAASLADEDGDYEDWIEIHNVSAANVNLLDWSLTDKASNLTKWRFPATNLPPGGYLVVFASNKDRRTIGAPLHTNFKLSASGSYLALVDPTGTNIATQFAPAYPAQVTDVSYGFATTSTNFTLIATGATAQVLVPSVANGGSALTYNWTGITTNEPFATSSWTSGPTGVGFGTTGIGLNLQSAMLNSNASAFVRIAFPLTNATDISVLTLNLKYNDGFIAWINGAEIARAFAPSEDLAWNSSATGLHTNLNADTITLDVTTNLLRNGTNILAIQGLNIAATNNSFLVLPELIGTIISGEETIGAYFTQPTPGAKNIGGSTVPGPGIPTASHTPNIPQDNDNLNVTAQVFATANPVSTVTLHYRVMFNSEVSLSMFDDGAHGDGAAGDGIYGATIPASASTTGQMVRYYITATDNASHTSRLPVFNTPTGTAQYFGTVVNPNYVTSALPVIHLFAPTSVLQPGPTTSQIGADSDAGGYVSVYYDGELYDNVRMWLRGNTTAGYNKKSHRITFNKEHPFKTTGKGGRITRTSFVADYVDPTYMRQGLSYWLCDEIGASGPFYSPVRLQLNGAFYQLANENDVHGEELLQRLGYDPNGALYNAAGTIQTSGFSTGGFDKKTRVWDSNADYTAFASAISEANSTNQRLTNLCDLFDVPEIISYMVAARFAHENDDVWANMSIYHDNDGDGLWRIIPFDMNLSWGAAYMDSSEYYGIQATNDYIKSFPLYGSSQAQPGGGGNWNRLYDIIFQVPQTREMFLRRLRTVLDAYVLPPGTPPEQSPIYQKIIAWRNVIGAEAQTDRNWWGWPGLGGQCNFDPGITLTNGVTALLNDFLDKRRDHFYGKHSITNTALTVGISKSQNAGIPLAQPTNATITIAAMDYNPVSGNQDEEYVKLTNPNSYAVDISDWELDGGIQFKFQKGTVIPANGTLYVAPNLKAFRNRATSPHGGQGLFVVGPYHGHLNAWGESLTLANSAGSLIASNSFAGNPSAAQRYLRVTEIMYNPSPFTAVTNDAQQFEYIELKNISTNVTLNLTGVRFTNGIYFNFTGSAVTSLNPQQTVLLVRNQAAFIARYGNGFTTAGQFTGALDNGGETLRLEDAVGEKILEFAYNNTWYPITDGLGFSLVIGNENALWSTWDQKSSWRASGTLNGSPGNTDPQPPAFSPILVNEVLTHTDLPELDSIELYNPTTNIANLGGWFLTDDFYAPKKYRIPTGTTIPAGGYLVFTEDQFNTGANAFRFSEYGEDVYLFSGDANTNLTGYYQGYQFGEAPNGVSLGRYTNSQGEVFFTLQSAVTLGSSNAYPRVGPIVISEIMYHPADLTNDLDDDLNEYLELQNTTINNVPLYDPAYPTNSWRLRNAVDYDFPTNQTLAAGARLLVVGFNPTNTTRLATFRAKYGISNTVAIYGPWSGKLDNSGETIELKQPGPPDDSLVVPFYMMDKIAYSDAAPWPSGADGIGNSLQRVSNTGYGNDPTNWFAAGTTAGRATIPNLAPTLAITAPTSGAQLIATNVTISVTASDPDGSLTLVELYADGNKLAQWSAGSSNYVWNTVVTGAHTVWARATDNLGAITVTTNLTFTTLSPPPTIQLNSPAAGAIVLQGSSVAFTATANSGGGAAASVSYFVDDALVGVATSPFNLNWTANAPGYHTITAIAYDAVNQPSEPAQITIFVQAVAANPELIPASSTWRYLDNGSAPATDWLASSFSDAAWSSGTAKFGFNGNGNSGITTVLSYGGNPSSKYPAYHFRREFVVSSLAGMTNLYLEVQRDDGVAIYLNGSDLYRNNLPTGTLSYSQLATNASDNGNTWQTVTLPLANLVVGTNLLAAEVHQSSLSSSDLGFDLHLTLLGYARGPALLAQPTNATVGNGSNATFTVTATGDAPLVYRWYFNDTLLAANTAVLSVANAQATNAGNYFAVVSNSVGVVTSSVVALTVNGNLDSDGDGLPDNWELANGTNPSGNDANADPDHDGLNNLQEYWAGTSPTNAASALRFTAAFSVGANLAFSFDAMSNHSYTVQRTPQLGGAWLGWTNIAATASNRSVWITNQNFGTNTFYRLITPAIP